MPTQIGENRAKKMLNTNELVSGPRSVLPEPDPNSKTTAIVRLPTSPAVRYWNMARQRYYRS